MQALNGTGQRLRSAEMVLFHFIFMLFFHSVFSFNVLCRGVCVCVFNQPNNLQLKRERKLNRKRFFDGGIYYFTTVFLHAPPICTPLDPSCIGNAAGWGAGEREREGNLEQRDSPGNRPVATPPSTFPAPRFQQPVGGGKEESARSTSYQSAAANALFLTKAPSPPRSP